MRGRRKSPPVSARAAHLFSVSSGFLEIPFFFSLPFLFIWVHRKKRPSLNSKIFRAVFRFRAQWCANSIRFRKTLPAGGGGRLACYFATRFSSDRRKWQRCWCFDPARSHCCVT